MAILERTENQAGWRIPAASLLVWLRSLRVPVARTFEDVKAGQWLVYEGSSCRSAQDNRGLIELAIREGKGKNSAKNRLGVDVGDVLKLSWRF